MQAHGVNADFKGFGDVTRRHACGRVGRVSLFGTSRPRTGMLTLR
jgi:hypothetical protein